MSRRQQWSPYAVPHIRDNFVRGATRAVVKGYVLDVDENGDAYVTAPKGGSVTVLCR